MISFLKKKYNFIICFFFLLFSIGPKKQIIEKPSMAPIIEDVIESTGPIGMFSNASIRHYIYITYWELTGLFSFIGSGRKRTRKSVSASAVPQKTPLSPSSSNQDESRVTRSRSQSSSMKVLDVMFTPVKIKSVSGTKKKEEEESRRGTKRYAVNVTRKSYKIPK